MAIAVFDLDGTVIRGDSFVAFLWACLQRHPRRVTRCLHLPLAVVRHTFGLRDNTWLKTVFVEAIIGGLSRRQVEEIAVGFAERLLERRIKPEARRTLDELSARGFRLVMASASLDAYVEPLAAGLGFDHVISTRLAWRGDVCSGGLDGGNCYGDAKRQAIVHRFGRIDLAYSDHHSDLPLLLHAGQGVAVDPDRKLAALAAVHDLQILRWQP
ncbi:MAG: HAD-IB family hydrolase [Pseudomonadales bacterium]